MEYSGSICGKQLGKGVSGIVELEDSSELKPQEKLTAQLEARQSRMLVKYQDHERASLKHSMAERFRLALSVFLMATSTTLFALGVPYTSITDLGAGYTGLINGFALLTAFLATLVSFLGDLFNLKIKAKTHHDIAVMFRDLYNQYESLMNDLEQEEITLNQARVRRNELQEKEKQQLLSELQTFKISAT